MKNLSREEQSHYSLLCDTFREPCSQAKNLGRRVLNNLLITQNIFILQLRGNQKLYPTLTGLNSRILLGSHCFVQFGNQDIHVELISNNKHLIFLEEGQSYNIDRFLWQHVTIQSLYHLTKVLDL